ncbi:MAG: Smr/MutS family protein, partial [Spirochaetota bacterium]
PALGPRAVPIDVELPEGTRTLIITGPNTGGKTVTLKTIGLLALMNQFGLALPTGPGTGFAVFDAVFADIGDEQSIDQSLSTFSGHMRTIGSICGGITGRSLVLLDELGSGTDPEEGSAVAMGLLDFFIARKSLTILTTHHGILKNYGYTRPGCLNACMDFDAASLQPTYRVLMGVPGESRALDIAAGHGLPGEVVAAARGYLDEERADVSELIKGLSERHRKLEDLESERKGRLREAMDSQRRADLASLRVRQREIELREEGVSGLKRQLSESRKTLENLVRGLREGGITAESTHEVKAFLGQLAVLTDEASEDLERFREESVSEPPPVEAATGAAPPFGPGVSVLAGSARRRGIIVRAAKKGHWLLETDTMRLTLPESELTAIAGVGPVTRTEVAVELAPRGDTGRSTAVFELDLRGFRLAAAIDAVEKQVDAASLQGLSVFTLLHGTGEGILGKGIHDYLKTRAGIANYHFARPEEGGYGKTVVSLQ